MNCVRSILGVAGVDAGRIVFAPKVKSDVHLRRIELANLTLDTQFYNAHVALLPFSTSFLILFLLG